MRTWLAAHRPLLATVTSGTVIAAIVAAVAIVSNGYTAQKMELGDGSVWVANGDEQVIGRANTAVFELNTIVRGDSTDLQVLQSGSTVLLVDRANATLTPVDPATSQAGESIALPPQQPEVHVAGDRIVIFAAGTGELWIVPIADLTGFDATMSATLSLGLGAAVSVDPAGVLFAYSPESDQVFRVDTAVSDEVDRRWPVTLDSATGRLQLTSVAGSWALLDPGSATLTIDGRTVQLGETLDSALTAVVQLPSVEGDRVLVATSGSLLGVPLGGGGAETIVDGRTGVPAAPLVLDGCSFAAWSVGTAWRKCAGGDERLMTLDSPAGGGALAFLVNGHQAVLNDARRGGVWAVQQNGELIDNWAELIEQEDEQDEVEENSDDDPPEVEADQKPPVAADDEFGARPGRATLLPVLLNDYDPNADVLVITEVTPIDDSKGRLDLVTRNQQLLLTLPAAATGSFSFDYTISDGRGGESGATVTVSVRQPSENSPPHQVRDSKTSVKSGGRVTTQVIGDWVDPDGDAFYLTAASVAAPDQASYKPDGVVVFSDSGEGEGVKTVGLVMSDGRESGNGSLKVTVRPVGEVPIVVEPWILLATAGQEVTVRPLLHVRGGNGPIRLNAVPAKAGTTTVPSFEAGTFTFVSDEVRTHYMEFTVTDGEATATGLVRIDVAAPPDANTRPVTVPKTIFVTTLSSQTVDPTTTDIDPAGGVLVVTGVVNVPPTSGIQAEVIDQRIVRISLSKPLDAPVTINYRISNGLAEAEGTITVVEIPRPLQLQPPLANDDTVTVRVGDAIDIPVLANDEQPDGEPITLSPDLAQPLPEGAGLLFASGDVLRYLAPQTAGNYTAVYTVKGSDEQEAQARVLISVRERNAATNNPPVPVTVVARVIAGETVKIDVPLNGIDPDGDAVQLIGQETNPEKGAVLSVGPGVIEYEAGVYSSGTDTFRYTVVDGLGARATGTIRVGISASLEGSRNPVANEDVVLVRPGRTVSVQVLANDSDPDGRPLHVQSVVPNTPGTTAEVVDGAVVKITPPETPDTYAVIYTIANEYGGTSSAFVKVTVDPEAPLAYPIVGDTVLTVSDVLDRDTVDVDVLDNVFFADGDVSELGLDLLPGYSDSAELLQNGLIRVTIGQRSQIIPFSVSHPIDPNVRSYGFIWVPGTDDALPQINTKAPPLRVTSEESLVIDLDRYVVALGGSRVRLTDSSTVRATHANGDDLVVDDHTLVFTSADRYFGPASITFEVTDGSPAVDGSGHAAILSLPITVDPRDNQPPVFRGGVVDFEPGQEKELDLVRLTDYPYDDIDELVYGILTPLPVGFSSEINGQRLLLRADESAVKGTTTSIALSVQDAVNVGQSGRIILQVVPSTRPLASPAADSAITRRGETTVIDVLANDQATNPFPEEPLRVVAIRGLGGSNLPEGVSVTPSGDRSRLTVTVSDTAAPIDTNLQYQVADATGDPDRMVWGNVTISVQDVPDPVTNLHATEFGDRTLKLAWSPGQFNNSPITEYRVKVLSASDGSTLSTVTCTTTAGCAVSTPGNGPSNAVRISVTAVNAIGESEATAMPGTIWSDIIPPPPTGLSAVPIDHGLRVTWTEPDSPGSPIETYVVTVNGVVRELDPTGPPTATAGCSGGVCTRNVRSTSSIPNGSSVTYTVSARNSAPNSLASWNEASGSATPAGPPLSVGSPSATGSVTDGTSATVEWGDDFSGNGKAISRYYVAMYTDSPPSCVVEGVDIGEPVLTAEPVGPNVQQLDGSASSATFGGLLANQTYKFTVFAYNGQGCTSSPEVEATPRAAPGTVTAVDTTGPVDRNDGIWDFRLDGITASGDYDSFMYRLSGGDTEGTEYGPVDFGSYLTAGTTHYGNVVSVQVKACRQYPPTLCSADWSPAFLLGTPVRIELSGLDRVIPDPEVPDQGYWTWSGAPSGPGYDSVSFDCGPADVAETPECEVQSGPPQDTFPDLVVTITANGDSYTREYSWQEP